MDNNKVIETNIVGNEEVIKIKKSRFTCMNPSIMLEQEVKKVRVLPPTITNPNMISGRTIHTKASKELNVKIFSENRIGSNIYRNGTLANTMRTLRPLYPRQIVLDDANKPFAKIDKQDIKQTYKIVRERNLNIFVHAPFLYNLSKEPTICNDYIVKGLKQQLKISNQCGFKGVVVHVGKSVGRNIDIALENMRYNITECLCEATLECPLLLETPAGRGSETLCEMMEFINFVASFNDRRLGICCDTCHIFSTKENILPSEYIRTILYSEEWSHLLKLIHLNDSEEGEHSCKDLHATIGTGKIPTSEFLEVVSLASIYGVAMVTEDDKKEPSDEC